MSYTIKQVSEKYDISPYTLRYYEKEGLLPAINRTDNGNRLYSDRDLERLHFIKCMRATGMSISYIKNYVNLCRHGEETIPERREIILRQKEIIEAQIKEYESLLQLVEKKLTTFNDITDFAQKIWPKTGSD